MNAVDESRAQSTAAIRDRRGLRRRFNSAEAVADALRDRILSGGVADRDLLPKQEELTEEFGVSKAAIREACRILETEGLLRVRRGNVGGAVAHEPTPTNVAYALALVLHTRGVELGDVRATIGELEPVCAGLCAARRDRRRTVLPQLRRAHEQLRQSLDRDDGSGAAVAAREWHEALARTCGLETMAVIAGALEAVWSSHIRAGLPATRDRGLVPDPVLSVSVVDDHAAINELIEAGDVPGAIAAARDHLHGQPRIHADSDELSDRPVQAHTVRDQLFGG
jgi:GntR family transcriptional repressor for pyruvate dehydrogenase complex